MQPDDSKARLWPGAYKAVYDRRRVVLEFFRTAQECADHVLRSLCDDVLPIFIEALEGGELGGWGEPPGPDLGDQEPEHIRARVRPALSGWASLSRLLGPTAEDLEQAVRMEGRKSAGARAPEKLATGDHPREAFGERWVYPIAYRTLLRWARLPPRSHRLEWDLPELQSVLETLSSPEFTCTADGWNVLMEQRSEAAKRILDHVRVQLDAYFDALAAQAEQSLLRRPHQLSVEHLVWLAHYQLNGRSYGEIAKEFENHRQNVAKAVRTTAAAIIGPRWPEWLRPGRRGGRPHRKGR